MFVRVVDAQVELRMLTVQQARAYYTLLEENRRHISEWEAWAAAATLESTTHYIRVMADQYVRGSGFSAAIYYRAPTDANSQLVGNVSYRINRENTSAEIGYWLAQSLTGRGIATRSARSLVAYAFEDDHLNRVVIRSATGNTRSCAVAERLGFTRDGVIRDDLLVRGQYHDRAYYTLLASEWADHIV